MTELQMSGALDISHGRVSLSAPDARRDEVRVVVVGHSHCACVYRALVADRTASGDADRPIPCGIAALSGPDDDSYWDAAYDLARGRTVAIMWHGNQHNCDFLFANAGVFDFVPRGDPTCSIIADAALVAEDVVRQHFQPSYDDLSKVIDTLRARGATDILVLGTPAPRGDEAQVRARVAREPILLDIIRKFGFDIATIPITPFSVRLKLWSVLQEMSRLTGAANGLSFHESPPRSHDENGLKPEFWASDLTHANERYGDLVVRDIADALATCLAHA